MGVKHEAFEFGMPLSLIVDHIGSLEALAHGLGFLQSEADYNWSQLIKIMSIYDFPIRNIQILLTYPPTIQILEKQTVKLRRHNLGEGCVTISNIPFNSLYSICIS